MKRPWLTAVAVFLGAVLGLALACEAGLRLNATASVPRGAYWLTDSTPQRGVYAAACLPERLGREAVARGYLSAGRCEGGSQELLKVVAATGGDHVVISDGGVSINGRRWPGSSVRRADGQGRALSSAVGLARRLGDGEALLLSEQCGDGFDSRYFGPLPTTQLRGTAVPLLLVDLSR